MKRKIVHIDEEKCTGCGLCVPACQEGAIKIENGKAKLVAENLCDGLGDCLNECPEGAIIIEEREAEPFDEKAVEERLNSLKETNSLNFASGNEMPCGCPSSQIRTLERHEEGENFQQDRFESKESISYLNQWPIQLALIPPKAEFLQGADLLISADCVPFAYGNFHHDFLKGKTLLIGCPKLDNAEMYVEKLAQIFSYNDIKSITLLYMEIPCCTGLKYIVEKALFEAEKDIAREEFKISPEGKAISE